MNRKTTKKVDESTLTTFAPSAEGHFWTQRASISAEPTPGSSSRMSARIARHDMGLTTTFSPLSVNQK